MTARSDKYDTFRESARLGGASEDEIDSAVAFMEAEDEKIDTLVCPRCGAKLTKVLDSRQAGPTQVAGKWFNYRCIRRCGWFADRCEPIGEN